MSESASTAAVFAATVVSRRAEMESRGDRRRALEACLASATSDAERVILLQAYETSERGIARGLHRRVSEDDFESLRVLGRGAFGEVTLVRERTGRQRVFALKCIPKTSAALTNTRHSSTERLAMSITCANSWVVPLQCSWQSQNELFLVMEFVVGGDLMSLLIERDTLPEAHVKLLAAELIIAIGSVHEAGFIHRDVKPDNILLDSCGHVVLSDFGLAASIDINDERQLVVTTQTQQDAIDVEIAVAAGGASLSPPSICHAAAKAGRRQFSCVGTPDYLAVEVLKKTGYGKEVDWWSLGCVIYESLMGFPPFYSSSAVSTCRKILDHKTSLQFPLPRASSLTPEAISFVRALITDAAGRLGAGTVGTKALQEHAWFTGVDWALIESRTHAMPYVPPGGAASEEIKTRLGSLPRDDAEFAPLLAKLCEAFDDFESLPHDDPRTKKIPQGVAGVPVKDYTWRRPRWELGGASCVAGGATAAPET